MPDEPIGPLKPADTFVKPADPKPYIRTFAQDMAAANNTPAPAAVPVVKDDEVKPVVVPPVVVEQPSAPPSAPVEPVAKAPEPVEAAPSAPVQPLPAAPQTGNGLPSDTFWYTPKAGEKTLESTEPAAEAAKPASLPTSVETEADREAILTRLREKLSSHQGTGGVAPATIPEAPIRTAAPDLTKVPAPELPKQPAPVPAPEPIPVVPPVEKPAAPAPLHTYKSDFADHIDTTKATTFSVLAAQSDSRQATKAVTKPKSPVRTRLIIAAAVILAVGAGAAGIGYVVTGQQDMAEPVTAILSPSLVRFDERISVSGEGPALVQAIASAAEGTFAASSIVVMDLEGVQMGGETVFSSLSLPAPAILVRNIDDSTVGAVNTESGTYPFIVLRVASYERTFAGMLAWESKVRDDLGKWYPSVAAATPVGTTTAATFQTEASALPFFVDTVVGNRDARALRDTTDNTLMLYGYADKRTLIIARDGAAFSAIIDRLEISNP